MLIRLIRQWWSASSRRRAAVAPNEERLARAVQMHRDGRLADAASAYRALLERSPDAPAILSLLGHCLTAQKKPAEAVTVLRRAASLDAGSADTLFNLAMACKAQGDAAEALDSLRKALQLRPDFVEAHLNAADLCKLAGAYADAEGHFRTALAIAPGHAEAHHNFGNFLYNLGRSQDAIECFRRAIAAKPQFALAHGSLVAVMSATPGLAAQEIYREQRAWASRFADPLAPPSPRYANPPQPQRRLRIGYVSPDLWRHPIATFFEPLLACHDRAQFEICCYYTASVADPVNQRLRALCECLVDCAGLSDDALAQRIRDDGIDILVDLSAHTKNNRLAVFARKPAPLQVSYLGYPTSTGIAAIDYRLSDHQIDPPGVDACSAEQVVRLPDTYWCFRAPETLPAVGPLPAASRGYITFGSFNNIVKLNSYTIGLWAEVLHAVPTAKLFLKTKSLADTEMRQMVAANFAGHGIAEERLIMRGWEAATQDHLAQYNEVDIAIDPTPYNGVTTTCEALLMGVPTVTLKGDTHLSRMGASLLQAAGLPEFIAATRQQYVETYVALARDLPALAQLRSQLRERLRASALMNEAAFVQALEREYRRMWQAWCERQP